ncbi:DUF4062 domain-containing protein [Microbacterium saccharophilum]|uniref:DUF4062 domain-containing protein n=1 Tax=Microbacterium saccharophilum TaxID=1213358 RepID=A0A5C8I7S1_9MICO|nr:DUF4062 domain-containing protein [Microbacterium saccharophilum]TXK15427.1 DUF4062 domain-containing protein [Microbacterium saccharophilum]GEP47140.1 hypothetical protein MSA03_06480 [Microbacterium saccharophilum]
MAAPRAIRTPDQRLRIFVSSTLRELEPERRAARAAIERLRLAPVMFELGARPHPPRELYRSYLAQSDVFVGVYGQQYGWVAPGEDVSGLEDEYRLSAGMPSLIYVREPAGAREPRLEELLQRIRDDDRVSYKSFRDAEELGRLLQDDLAVLLTEQFDQARAQRPAEQMPRPGIPAPYSPLVGREAERDATLALLAQESTRLVTLTGAGGIGKSRLAIEVALEVARAGRDVAFTLLEAVSSPERVIDALARSLGVRDAASAGSLTERVISAIGERDTLLVIDNMEHLLGATATVMELITGTPRLQVLVTSRAPLRVRPERVVEVGPLAVPADGTRDVTAAQGSAALALFVQRGAAVQPGFTLTPANVGDVVKICRALEGVPLAIELAAARLRTLAPADLLARLDTALGEWEGPRDLPERQRTLRATMAWSVQLLGTSERRALAALAAFRGAFTVTSAERVLAAAGVAAPLDALAGLIDASLVGHGVEGDTRVYRLLTTVRTYAAELAADDERERSVTAWIEHYCTVVARAAPRLRGPDQLEQLAALELESENIAAVGRELVERGRFDEAAEYAWSLYLYLWIGGYLGVVRALMTQLLAAAGGDLAPHSRAIALYYTAAIRFWQDAAYDPRHDLTESRDLFDATGDPAGAALAGVSIGLAQLARPTGPDVPAAAAELERSLSGFRAGDDTWGQAMSLVMLGRIALAVGDPAGARSRFEDSLGMATAQGERLGIVIAHNHLGWARLFLGDLEGARQEFGAGLDLSLALGHDEGIAYGLEGFVGLRAAESDARGAGLLLGAAQALRLRKGVMNPGAFDFFAGPLERLRADGRTAELDEAIAQGRDLSVNEAIALVRR